MNARDPHPVHGPLDGSAKAGVDITPVTGVGLKSTPLHQVLPEQLIEQQQRHVNKSVSSASVRFAILLGAMGTWAESLAATIVPLGGVEKPESVIINPKMKSITANNLVTDNVLLHVIMTIWLLAVSGE
ncbi:MAG: hypothetical protein WA151_12990 [Desulfatirhabdiaceae bacterium]